MRILVDHSGYDLLNVGDVMMLRSCVARLQLQWPDAEIMVIAYDRARLATYCPGVIAISQTLADRPLFRRLPRRLRPAAAQTWKIAAPYFSNRLGFRPTVRGRPCTVIEAVQTADLVVASGGGYVTDTWRWHGAGVLSVLSLAQRLGKPTAMFGQGIGPISSAMLRAQASAVLPKLRIMGLREAKFSRDLVLSLGMPSAAVVVTGDDALELIACTKVAEGNALGVNLRVTGYAGLEARTAAAIGEIVLKAATTLDAPIVGLPVSRHVIDSDASAIRALFSRSDSDAEIGLNDVTSPEGLVSAAASCRAIVTGSYHAAVFGLAQGVPAVCVSKSSYYDVKFGGLKGLFPDACAIVALDAPDWAVRLSSAILDAWQLPFAVRDAARDGACRLRDAGRGTYARFRTEVES